ncbi:MAG: hypothetical protein GPJ54_02605, partial [Candidatus Heimdallarchaeota archaeon]|nr:hypothetical protein [Candidatus Heimdallarchaeota archaeon]
MTDNIDRNIKFYFRKFMKFIHAELHEEGAYMIPLRIFIGIGWLRAAIEKLLDSNWLSGESLTNFINAQISGEQVYFPIYESILKDIILPNVQLLSIIVL